MSSQQRGSFAEKRTSALEQPLIREDQGTEDAKGEGEPRVMEKSGLGTLRHPVPYFPKGSGFEEETIEEKTCSDPNLQEPKEHSFMFNSVGEGPAYSIIK